MRKYKQFDPKLLKRARLQKSFSQMDLADMAGLTDRGIAHWEEGRRTPNANGLMKVAQVLEVPLESLFR